MKKFIDCVWTLVQLVGSGTERDRAGQSGEKAERDRVGQSGVGVCWCEGHVF